MKHLTYLAVLLLLSVAPAHAFTAGDICPFINLRGLPAAQSVRINVKGGYCRWNFDQGVRHSRAILALRLSTVAKTFVTTIAAPQDDEGHWLEPGRTRNLHVLPYDVRLSGDVMVIIILEKEESRRISARPGRASVAGFFPLVHPPLQLFTRGADYFAMSDPRVLAGSTDADCLIEELEKMHTFPGIAAGDVDDNGRLDYAFVVADRLLQGLPRLVIAHGTKEVSIEAPEKFKMMLGSEGNIRRPLLGFMRKPRGFIIGAGCEKGDPAYLLWQHGTYCYKDEHEPAQAYYAGRCPKH